VAQWITRGLYRTYLHPPSRFPGPKLYAFTRLPKVYMMYTGESHRVLHKPHQQYGDIVRVAPDELSFIHPDAWRDIYGHGTRGTQGSIQPKHYTWYGTTPNGVAHMAQAQGMAHPRMRRMFNPAFSDRALKEREPLFMKSVDQLVGNLRKSVQDDPDHKFDMVRNYNCKSESSGLPSSWLLSISYPSGVSQSYRK
ncbi:hypothetical protein BU23DRAFT_473537, partial [Bimuria novae-zelandiae CBS 107.79]